MKINIHRRRPLDNKLNLNFLWDKRWLTVGAVGLISMLGMVILFFVVFNYGGFLYKSGQTANYRYHLQMLKSAAKFDFSFLKNYMDGQMAEVEDITIDLKFKHLMRLGYLREQASREKFINPIFKEEEFPAKLTYNGQIHNVKIGLTGKMSRTHLGDPNKYSFQVKVKGDDTLLGMKRFGLLLPTVRGYLTDWLSIELMKERGLIGIRIDFVNVTINGKSNGLYYLEERFDKHLIESNSLREGIIFKLEKEVIPYQEMKLMQNTESKAQLLMLKRMWQDVVGGRLSPDQFFDMEKMAKSFVIADLINNGHPLDKENLRFYFNPVTGLAEPIAREFEDLEKNDPATLKVFLEKPQPFSTHFWHKEESVIRIITGNNDFRRFYVQEAAHVCQKEFLDRFFAKNKEEIKAILAKLHRDWPYYEMPVQLLYDNQQYMRSVLFPETDKVLARIKETQDSKIGIYLENQQYLPLEISHISWRDSILFYPKNSILLDSKPETDQTLPELAYFRIPEGFSGNSVSPNVFKLHYHLLGLPEMERTVPVLPVTKEVALSNSWTGTSLAANYQDFDFIKENAEGEILSISAGIWTVDHDLIIPSRKELQMAAGTVINLVQGAKIISYSPVYCLGLKNKPVIIQSSDASGEGLIVISADRPSSLNYTQFDQLSSPQEGEWPGSGSVTFYQSPVSITSSMFANNQSRHDFLRVLYARFNINRTQFKNVQGDALSVANCFGTINNSTFHHIGEDGITLVDAEVKVANLFIENVGGKGLSAEKNSLLEAKWIDVRRAETGIVITDRSKLVLSDAQMVNNRIGLAVRQEPTDDGPSFASVKDLDLQLVEVPFFIDKSCRLTLDGNNLIDSETLVHKSLSMK